MVSEEYSSFKYFLKSNFVRDFTKLVRQFLGTTGINGLTLPMLRLLSSKAQGS